MKQIVAAVVFAGTLLSGTASAAEFDWSACKAEVEKYCKAAKGDEATWKCLEENDSKLSKTCDAAHAKYEEKTGKKK